MHLATQFSPSITHSSATLLKWTTDDHIYTELFLIFQNQNLTLFKRLHHCPFPERETADEGGGAVEQGSREERAVAAVCRLCKETDVG